MTDTSRDGAEPQPSPEHEPSEQATDLPEKEAPAQQQESALEKTGEASEQESVPPEDSTVSGTDQEPGPESDQTEQNPPGQNPLEQNPSGQDLPEPDAAPAAAERTEAPDEESGQQSTGQIRLSRATPSLPPAALPDREDPGLSEFFDQLDEKLTTATGRIARAFRRPTGHEAPPVELTGWEPAEVDVFDVMGAPSRQASASESQELPEPTGDASAEVLPGDELPPPPPPAPGTEKAAAPADVSAGREPEAAPDARDLERADLEAERSEENRLVPPVQGDPEGPFSFPAPPSRAEANRGRRDLDEYRRREVIWEKASAIEAATALGDERSEQDHADDEDDLYTYIPPYNLPSRDPDPPAQRRDLHRQIFVSISAVAALVTSLWMFGAFSDPAALGSGGLDELSEGWFSGEQALLSPDAGFYWLWPLIALGLIAHAVHQWTTAQTSTPRQRRSGWLVGFASLMTLGWIAAVHAGSITLAALAALAAALALVDSLRQFNFHTARNSTERRFTDATVGLFAGWALVSAMSSVSVWLTALGIRIPGVPAVLWALVGLVICIWVAAFYSMTERGRITVALGMGWGMFWLIFPRLLSEVPSVWVAIGAAMGAFIVILATESRRHRINHAERRAAMGRPMEDII